MARRPNAHNKLHVPVIVIDRLDAVDRRLVRTELRRAIISAYEIENRVIAITGRIEAVRGICQRHAGVIGSFRCRKMLVDGEELNQAHDEPGQFKDVVAAEKISRFQGLDSATAWRLYEAFKAHQIEAGIVDNPDGSRTVMAEFSATRNDEVAAVLAAVTRIGYEFIGMSRGNS